MKKLLAFILCLILPIAIGTALCFAQEVEMADGIRASGKIYVVVGGLITILLGIILFLIMIDRKVSEIEKKVNSRPQKDGL